MKVFLGGTCAGSQWREALIPMLKIDYFNPVVEDWNEEAQKQELEERENCDYCLCVISPLMQGVYSIAEVIDDSNKRPKKTVFCYVESEIWGHDIEATFSAAEMKSLDAVGKMVVRNGGTWLQTLEEVADFLNKSG